MGSQGGGSSCWTSNCSHDTYPGINRLKSLARSYVWLPGLDSDIQSTVQKCDVCQSNRGNPPKAPLHPWEWPSDHGHDFTLTMHGPLFLIVVDAYSKWINVQIVPSTSAEATIAALRPIFSTFGLPQQMVSDNGTGFTSVQFQKFFSQNGVNSENRIKLC